MELVLAGYQVLTELDGKAFLMAIESAARTSYKSEHMITNGSAVKLVKSLIKSGHHSVLEHKSISVRFIADRGCTHCIVRYRMSSFTQESTRYVNYSKRGMKFVVPPWLGSLLDRGSKGWDVWESAVASAERSYNDLINRCKWTLEQARTVLPNSVAAEIVMTTNVREWRHFLSLEAAKPAHPQMRDLLRPLLAEFKRELPVLFDDILPELSFTR